MRTALWVVSLAATVLFVTVLPEGTRALPGCSSPADCDDGIYCTVDFCDPVTGCVHSPAVGIPCTPDNHCYPAGTCQGGVCLPHGFPLNCDDFNPCTVDGCDPATGCTHVGPTCDDGNACTLDFCTPPGICTFQPVDPSDGTSCTDDSCDPVTGEWTHTENGSCTANPKSLGYWQRVYSGTGHTADSPRGIDAYCIQIHSCTFQSITFAEISQILTPVSPQQPGRTCLRARQELLALILNICHSRLMLSNGIDSRCADNTSVGEALAEADGILCDPAPTEAGCDLAGCEAREINQGRALHVHALALQRLASGAIRLTWIPPTADVEGVSADTPHRYRIWRAGTANGPFVQIAEVTQTQFEDAPVPESPLVYDVTPVW